MVFSLKGRPEYRDFELCEVCEMLFKACGLKKKALMPCHPKKASLA